MNSEANHIVELIKYPVLVFSIVLALIVLKYSLNLEFGMITEVSTEGLKFSENSNKATFEAITELDSKLSDLSVRIASLENAGNSSDENISQTKAKAFLASQEVSDAIASIAQLSPPTEKDEPKKLIGWMWIGNFDDSWSKTPMADIDTGKTITIEPEELLVGSEYKVLGNMVIREGLPPNNEEYYRARKSLGVAPRGSTVKLLRKPEGVDREFAVQYWAEVEYTK